MIKQNSMLIEKLGISNAQIKKVSEVLVKNGYCYIDADLYSKQEDLKDILTLQSSFFKSLTNIRDKGGRSRAYKRFVLSGNTLSDETGSYAQSKEYNKTDGGKKRNFEDISSKFIETNIFKKILSINTSICYATGLLSFDNKVSIGVHQIRYSAEGKEPAYSTPCGLHKDNETIVFIHFLNQSSSCVGGVNYFAKDEHDIIEVIELNKPVETIVLSQKHFHAVSPMGVKRGNKKAFRDVLIITYESDVDFESRLQQI